MKTFIVKYSLIIIGIVILFLFVNGLVSRCTQTHKDEVVSGVIANNRQTQIIDSMRGIQVKAKLLAIDSVNRSNENKIKAIKPKIATLKLKTDALLQSYKKDTASQSLKADSTIQYLVELTDSMNMENEYLNEVNEGLKAQITVLEGENEAKDATIDNCTKNTEKLLKLPKKDNIFKRVEKWIYLGVGVVLTYKLTK